MKRIEKSAVATIAAIAIAMALPFLSGCDSAKKEAQEAFEAASVALEEKNAEVDAAIADLTEAMGSEIRPFDNSTMSACEEAISSAQGARVEVPEIADTAEEIQAQVAELEAVDYSDYLAAMAAAKTALLDSIKQMEQITNPSAAFVIQRLTGVEHILVPTAVTEDMDPNGQLGKQGGYTATVYFMSDLVDQSRVFVNTIDATGNEVIDKGTEGGGAVEVYANEEDAVRRDQYLSSFDGTIFSSGSHHVYGTCVIRTSDELTASQQKELEESILEALIRLDE